MIGRDSSLSDVISEVSRRYPIIASGLITPNDASWPDAEAALRYVAALPSSDEGLDHAIESFAMTSIEFLRLQARFRKTGKYACGSAAGLVDDLYSDAEEMNGYYLDGLAMTYALWPNHARLLGLLRDEFIPHIADGSTVVEVGPGHGMLGYFVLSEARNVRYIGVDISEPALDYTKRAFERLGVSQSAFSFVVGDATDLAASGVPSADAMVCCEVLEHVDSPAAILSGIRSHLGAGGQAFLSTVANLEARDHVYLFETVDQIRALIADSGLELDRDWPMRLPGDNSNDLIPYNYAGIVSEPG